MHALNTPFTTPFKKSLAKNPAEYVIEDGRGEGTFLPNVETNIKGH